MNNWKMKFITLGIGQAISVLTSAILQTAIIWYLTQKTSSPMVITLATLSGYLPRAVLGLFTGPFIDKYNRKHILIYSDLIIALAALILAIISLNGELPIFAIYIVLFIRSLGAAFHSPALNAVIPTIVPKEHLTRCAGISQGFESVSMILSPALAAFLFTIWNLRSIILLDVLGAFLAITIVIFTAIPVIENKSDKKLDLLQDTIDGLRILKSYSGMTGLLVISSLYAFIYFPVGSMYPLITMTYFGGSVADSSIVEIAFSVGTLVGSLLLGIFGNKLHKVLAIAMSIFIYGLGTTSIGLLPPSGLYYLIGISIIMGLTIPFFYGLRTSIFQATIPNEYLGRVLSLAYSISLFAAPLGLLFGGNFSTILGIEKCFFICGILAMILAIIIIALPNVRNSCKV